MEKHFGSECTFTDPVFLNCMLIVMESPFFMPISLPFFDIVNDVVLNCCHHSPHSLLMSLDKGNAPKLVEK